MIRWQFYYEFLCFDVPKVVRSPGCDHGHDEESRNGRDIKIDILDDYVQTPPPLVRIGQGGCWRPLSFLLSPSHPFPLLLQLGKEGVGVGLLPGAPSSW